MQRRELLWALAAGVAVACRRGERAVPDELDAIEARLGGRVGVFAVDTGDQRSIAHRADDRFALCSTFKWALVAAILVRVDRGALSLDERVSFTTEDLLDHAPVTAARVSEGAMTVEALAAAAITVSDNTAGNLLLAKLGGPAGLTAAIRALGDPVTRLDRDEPTLNEHAPDDSRDTTTPRAMVGLMRRVLCDDALSAASRERLRAWLRVSETGKDRLRAGLPLGWEVGDKTGTGPAGAVNDVAIAVPPGRAPILVAAYLSDSDADLADLVGAHAEIGRLVAARLG